MTTILSLEDVNAGYGDAHVLDNISLSLKPGEILAMVGANGAGKTTLLSTIAWLTDCTRGNIKFEGESIRGCSPHEIVARGVVLVPEGGRLFPFMTVRENLELGAYSSKARVRMQQSLETVLDLFPKLGTRMNQLAGSLSGGERTMCAIARGVMSCPKLLMLDEPSLGLSPLMVETVFDLVRKLSASIGIPMILVEQNIGDALEMAHTGAVLEHGRIVRLMPASELLNDSSVQSAYLGL